MTRGGFKYCFLFCCLLTLAIRARILRTPCISQAKFSYKRNNTRLVGALIAKYNNKERVECESACLLEPRCKAVNTKESECELHSKTISDFTDNCTESNSAIPNQGYCTLIKDGGWTFESTNYSNPLLGFNCNRNNPCGKEYLCMDTCICPGYECLHCRKVHNFPCPDVDECLQNPCKNDATCTNTIGSFKCTCKDGFTGALCETNIDDCAGVACHPGSCEDLINGYKCNCPPTFTGQHCEKRSNPGCSDGSFFCENGGTCVDEISGAKCQCSSSYIGPRCETTISGK